MKTIRLLTLLCAAVAMVVVATPRPAEACGGFFCSNIPIDQNAERIIFTHQGGEVAAYIQVQYTGAAEDFAWIVPVASVPEIEVADSQIFNSLDFATAPVIVPPSCLVGVFSAGTSDESDGDGNADPGAPSRGGVTVYNEATVGPFDTATVGSESASLLIDWLITNGYVITEPMFPIVEQYVQEGLLFVAMKLSVGQEVDALQPIVMTYESDMPVIPLRLTAVAAEPNMGVLVWVLGDTRAVPANYADVQLDQSRFRFDDFLRSNYRQLVTQMVDEVGGHGWVTEYAAPTADLTFNIFDEPTLELLGRFDYITRFYNTMNAEEMTVDPMFTFNGNVADVSNIIDLSDREDLCQVSTSPCDFNYCGPGSTCYEVSGVAACDCTSDQVARGVNGQNGPEVSCVPEDNLFEGVLDDPCSSFSCGEFGTCVGVNGQATCACDAGYAAADNGGAPTCVDISMATPADNQPPSLNDGSASDDSPAGAEIGCQVASGAPQLPALALVGLLAGLVVRRRR